MSEILHTTSPIRIPVDSEHGALRISIIGIFVAVWLVTFALVNSLIVSEGLNLIAVMAAFIAAGLIGRGSEMFLQKRWPSGRVVEIDSNGVRVSKRGSLQNEVKAAEPANLLLWRFQTKRRSRVPKGWYVLACAVEQDDNYLPVYTFASPDIAAELIKTFQFTDLVSEKDAKARDARQDSLRFAGEQRRLRLAETHRWTNGAEMSVQDFEKFLTQLNGQFQQWIF